MAGERSKQENGEDKQKGHMSKSGAVFDFLNLPAEIRNMIYWNALVKKHDCYYFRQPPLTRVNKQIRSESLPVLYGNGLFSFFYWRHYRGNGRLRRFRQMFPAMPNLAHITKLDVRLSLQFGGRIVGLDVTVHMRKDESKDGSLLNTTVVGRPGLAWKNRASIEVAYGRLIVNQRQRDNPSHWYETTGAVVENLLYFAERCPAAAEWVWMKLERHQFR